MNQVSVLRRVLARLGQVSVPISVVIVTKNDSAAAPSRYEPVRLVIGRNGFDSEVCAHMWRDGVSD
jgi:hypothetical protein